MGKLSFLKGALEATKMNLQSTWKKSCVSEAKIAAFSLIKKTPPDPQGIDAKQCYVNIAKAEKFMNCILTLRKLRHHLLIKNYIFKSSMYKRETGTANIAQFR